MAEGIDIPVTVEQFMRDARSEAREINKLMVALGLSEQPLPYPEVELHDQNDHSQCKFH